MKKEIIPLAAIAMEFLNSGNSRILVSMNCIGGPNRASIIVTHTIAPAIVGSSQICLVNSRVGFKETSFDSLRKKTVAVLTGIKIAENTTMVSVISRMKSDIPKVFQRVVRNESHIPVQTWFLHIFV